MIFSGFGYRAHDPKWAFSPLSGDGAAIHGGRFNPVGVPALYLATTPEGAVLEASHGLAYRFAPLTLCAYELNGLDLIDLADPAVPGDLGISPDGLAAPWFLDKMEGRRPASWVIHDKLASQCDGIIVPSFASQARPDMRNIVLWSWADKGDRTVRVIDPQSRLPKNQTSWE